MRIPSLKRELFTSYELLCLWHAVVAFVFQKIFQNTFRLLIGVTRATSKRKDMQSLVNSALLSLCSYICSGSRCFQTVHHTVWGHAVAHLFVALRYKPKGRGFDSRWCPRVDSASNRSEQDKGKFTLEQAMKAQKGSRCIGLLFL